MNSEALVLAISGGGTLLIGGTAILIVTILGIQSLLSVYVEHKHFHILNHAAVSLLLGVILGLIVHFTSSAKLVFDQSIFFFVLLPIIVFKEGYGLNKQHFFKNFFYVCLYGIIGTFFNFLLIVLMTYYMNKLGWILVNGTSIELPWETILLYSACITSKDSAVTLSVLDFDLTPKLHSIIFGEQILNDVVVFSLQKSSMILGNQQEFYWYSTFIFIGIIILQILVSFIVGLLLGLLATWTTKKCRFFIHHSSIITAFTVYFGYLAFALCETFNFCGVIAVLVCGVMLSHYQTYNLPKLSATSSKITVKALSYVSEAFMYLYIGFFLLAEYPKDYEESLPPSQMGTFSYSFFGIQFLFVIPLARFLSMLLSHGFAIVFRLKTKNKWRINKYEFFIIFYGGLIRGVVAFALISEEQSNDQNHLNVVQGTTLLIVLFTTLIIGGSLKYVCEKIYKIMDENQINRSSTLNQSIIKDTMVRGTVAADVRATCIAEEKEFYKKLHPKSEKLFKKIDENYIKPFLIFNYLDRKEDIKQAKKEERHKLERQKEDEEKLYDDSVRLRRIKNQNMEIKYTSNFTESAISNGHSNEQKQVEMSIPVNKITSLVAPNGNGNRKHSDSE